MVGVKTRGFLDSSSLRSERRGTLGTPNSKYFKLINYIGYSEHKVFLRYGNILGEKSI